MRFSTDCHQLFASWLLLLLSRHAPNLESSSALHRCLERVFGRVESLCESDHLFN
jgi:hypothetical protein